VTEKSANHISKYGDYTVEIGADLSTVCRIEATAHELTRIHYCVYRVPSEKKFVIRHHKDATAEDRQRAERGAINWTRGWWEYYCEARARRRRNPTTGVYYWRWPMGTLLDDPLIQLELEMMIDSGSAVKS